MMKNLLKLILFVTLVTGCNSSKNIESKDSPDASKILFICTNIDIVNGQRNGTFLSEIAVPFILFEENNFDIDIVSPKGGAIPIYFKFDTTEIITRALQSDYYLQKISSSLKPADVSPNEYDAIVIPGGYGQFWDINNNEEINKLIAAIYEKGGIIGSLGHGSSSLVNVVLSNGRHLVDGKTMTCFPSWFEKEVMFEADYGTLLPFDMEVELKKNGANLKAVDRESPVNDKIVDKENRLITASSASGGEFIATEIMKALHE